MVAIAAATATSLSTTRSLDPSDAAISSASFQAEDAAKIDRIVAEAAEPELASSGGATSRDPARLRGLPAVSRFSSGAVAGSDPVRAVLAKEFRRAF
jgi:hypothetical protein